MAAAKIRPLSAALPSPNSASANPSERQVYTVWMKSLVLNGHGCTIYGQDGRVAYRVDNYACKRSREVYVMDSAGKTLIKITKKNFGVFKRWKGYSCSDDMNLNLEEEITPWFTVQRARRILLWRRGKCIRGAIAKLAVSGGSYKIDGCSHKSKYRISDADGEVMAEIKRKQTASGMALGEDVLSLTVGPTSGRLLIVGLAVVCGLINRCM